LITGNNAVLQLGTETSYGTVAVMSDVVRFSSADFKPVYNKKDDGLLTGKLIGSGKETMSVKTGGNLSTLAKPKTTGIFLKGAFGVEKLGAQDETTKKYPHTFTLAGNGETDYLPSFTATVDKKAGIFSYNGLVIDSLNMSAAAEDYLKLDIVFVGKDEETGTLAKNLTVETAKAFKFRGGKAYIENTEVADVTSMKYEHKNNTKSAQTTSTGLYFSQPQQGTREITSEIEIVYSSATEALRGNWWKKDNTFAFRLNFADDDGNTLSLEILAAQVTACDPPAMSGTDELKQSVSVQAVAGDSEPVTAVLTNDKAEAY
jgi:hypothetical protein